MESKTSQAYWKKLSHYERKSKWNDRVYQSKPMYKKSNIALFLKVMSPFLLKEESYLEKNFYEIINRMGHGQVWLTQKDKNDYEEAAKFARGMQRQKEFIPY